jgi:hypothetical protein
MKKEKIFCIGFHKTGTKSLAAALTYLGYRVTGPNWVTNPRIREKALSLALELIPHYDAFQDNPWPILYQELHAQFPNARFILTLRSGEAWLRSIVRHFGETSTPMREWIYGVGQPRGNEKIYLARYERHNREVLDYFNDKPGRLLVLDITAGEGWGKLSSFLGEDCPDVNFPRENFANSRESRSS